MSFVNVLVTAFSFNIFHGVGCIGPKILLLYVFSSSVLLSVTLATCGHIGRFTLKLIPRLISLASSLLGAPTSAIWSKGNIPKIWVESGWGHCLQQKTCNISEMGQDKTKVAVDH